MPEPSGRRTSNSGGAVRAVRRAGIAVLSTLVVAGFLACSGSGTESGEIDSLSVLERQRRAAAPEALDYLVRAQDAYRQGAYQRALALTDSAGAIEDSLADLYALRGHILTELRRFEDARSDYRTALEIAPDYQGAWFNLGNLAFREGSYREATNLYRRAVEANPAARAYDYLGRSYEQLGVIDSARWAYERSIEQDSSFATGYMRIGQLLEDEGRVDEALAYSERGLELDSTNSNYRYVVGSQRYQTGRIEEAIPLLREVVRERPGHQGAHYNLGQALLRAGREEEANRFLAEADSLEQVQSEIERLRSVAEDNPKNVRAWLDLANELRRAGEYESALEAYEVARSIEPGSIVVRGNIADLHQRLGNTRQAIAGYRQILRRDSTVVSAWFNLGVVFANAGRYDEARRAWNQVLRHRPDHARARVYLQRIQGRSSP